MKMYTWSRQPIFIAVAHADSVKEARELLLAEIGDGDGSCPERETAHRIVATETPSIWLGRNVAFALTDSGELRESEATVFKLRQMLAGEIAKDPREAA